MTDSALLAQRPTAAEREARVSELQRQMFIDLDMFGLVWSSHYYVAPAPDLTERIDRLSLEELAELRSLDATSAEYVHWDDIRFMEPRGGLGVEEWWMQIREARTTLRRPLPLIGLNGAQLSYAQPEEVLVGLDAIDIYQAAYARQAVGDALLDEAIGSSALAGAAVTSDTAERLVGERREPQDDGEAFLLRGVRALELVRRKLEAGLTPDSVLAVQKILSGDEQEDVSGAVIERLHAMCDFANAESWVAGAEMHPVLRAILLHFWLLYEHPFATANGRTARAIFYWAVWRAGYSMFDWLSISPELRLTPSQYCRSFVEADTDGGDVTYFAIEQLHVIQRAMTRAEALER
ncbi:MAG TPA: Fic family protein [Solirubrobacteraceae bacterium]|nr:Fic family protein [Solirubrobacteraceae bacterium]